LTKPTELLCTRGHSIPGLICSKFGDAEDIHPWWIWGYWISPLSYAQNALGVNEFLAPRWKANSLGLTVLQSRGIFTRGYWYWLGAAALVGYIIFFNILVTFALGYFERKLNFSLDFLYYYSLSL
jgi:hypothetical protein